MLVTRGGKWYTSSREAAPREVWMQEVTHGQEVRSWEVACRRHVC